MSEIGIFFTEDKTICIIKRNKKHRMISLLRAVYFCKESSEVSDRT